MQVYTDKKAVTNILNVELNFLVFYIFFSEKISKHFFRNPCVIQQTVTVKLPI